MSTILVGGFQRTGTNLMQTILCQDPATNPMIHECQYLTVVLSTYVWAKNQFSSNTSHYFSTLEALREFHRRNVTELLDNVHQIHGESPHLVLKHPELTRYFPDLLELHADCLFICMIRDPRDAIASKIKVLEKQPATAPANHGNTRNVLAHCNAFQSYYSKVFSVQDPEFTSRIRYVRYEDLVTSPESVLTHLRSFTGLGLADIDLNQDLDTGAVNYEDAGPAWKPWITPHYGKAITTSRVGAFSKTLTAQEIEVVEHQFQHFLDRFGYVRS